MCDLLQLTAPGGKKKRNRPQCTDGPIASLHNQSLGGVKKLGGNSEGIHSYERVYVKATADSWNGCISELTRKENEITQAHVPARCHCCCCRRAGEERMRVQFDECISSYTNTHAHKYKYTTQWSNYSLGWTVICSSLT